MRELPKIYQNWIDKGLQGLPFYYRDTIFDLPPGVLLESFEKRFLHEGYYRTHSIDETADYLKRKFNLPNGNIKWGGELGETIALIIPKEFEESFDGETFKKGLKEALHTCGWFIARKSLMKDFPDFLCYIIEPRFPVDEKFEYKYYWHITPKKYKEKILKRGLVPKSSNKIFSYPDRVYLFKGSLPYSNVLMIYKRMLQRQGYEKSIECTLFKVHLNQATFQIKTYPDPDFDGKAAIFVKDNISPQIIEWCGDYTL